MTTRHLWTTTTLATLALACSPIAFVGTAATSERSSKTASVDLAAGHTGVTAALAYQGCATNDGVFFTAEGGCMDLATGLVWSTTFHNWSWQGASDLAENLEQGGFSDWRLATLDELEEVYLHGATTHLESPSDYTWSSRKQGNWAWVVHLVSSGAREKIWGTSSVSVICVREATFEVCNNDGICDPGEDCENCDDCAGKINGPPANRYCCGNGIAEDAEGDGTICDGNY